LAFNGTRIRGGRGPEVLLSLLPLQQTLDYR